MQMVRLEKTHLFLDLDIEAINTEAPKKVRRPPKKKNAIDLTEITKHI